MTKASTSLASFVSGASLPALTDAEMANALGDAVQDATTGDGSGVQFLSFSGKSGRFSLGQSKENIDPEDLYIIEPQTVVKGWNCWKGGKVVGRHEWSAYRPELTISEEDLEDHGPYKEDSGDGWQRMLGFGLISTDGLQTAIKFTNNSKSGRNVIGDLLDQIKDRLTAGEPSIPIVSFDAEEFTAQDKKNYKPEITVDVWVERASVVDHLAGGLDFDKLKAGAKPKPKRTPKKK